MPVSKNTQRLEEMYAGTQLPPRQTDQASETAYCIIVNLMTQYETSPGGSWLPRPDVEKIPTALFRRGITVEDIRQATVEDLSQSVQIWRTHRAQIAGKSSTGRGPNYAMGYLANVLERKKHEASVKAKEQEAQDAQRNEFAKKISLATRSIGDEQAMRDAWNALTVAQKRKIMDEHRRQYPRLSGEVIARADWWRKLSDEEKAKWKGAKR